MSFTEFDVQSNTFYKKLTEDMKYINAKLENINAKIPLEVSSGYLISSKSVNTLQETNQNKLNSIIDYESTRNIEDSCNTMTHKSANRNRKKNMNLHNEISTSDAFETFSKLMEYQYDSNNLDKVLGVNNFENDSSFLKKVKSTTESADKYIQKLSKEVLPRCRTSKITSNIVQREIDIPVKVTQFQSSMNKQPDTNILLNNSNKKPKSISQNEYIYERFVNSSKNVCKTNNSHVICNSPKAPGSVKFCKNNIGLIHIKAQVSEENKKDDCKLQNLTVNRSYKVNVKPQLCTKKLDYFQIRPDDKQNVRNSKSNVTYREFTFGLEPCKCKPMAKPGIMNDKKVALSEIHKILYELMYDVSSNVPLNNYLISQLQKIMLTLCDIKAFGFNGSKVLKDLVEEHSLIGFNEITIKKKLIEIAEQFEDDQITAEIESSNNQATKQGPAIKNLIYSKNVSMKLPDPSKGDKLDNKAKYTIENYTNLYPNVTSHFKSYDTIIPTKYISVRNFLLKNANNLTSSKKYKYNLC